MTPVVVVGGGPAGLMAADVLSAAGVPVTVYDRMPSVGRKFLMAGRGGLNLTHGEPVERLVERYGPARPFIEPLISRFPPQALIAWVNELGQETFTGSSGRIFPRVMKASPLLRAWLARLTARGVQFRVRHHWTGIDEAGRALFEVPGGSIVAADPAPIVLALGGASWPRLGSDANWLAPLAVLGAAVRAVSPANAGVQIAWSEHVRTRFAGHALKRIRVRAGDKSHRGEAVITAGGLEGGVIYALNPEIREQLVRTSLARLTIDLRPDLDEAALAIRLSQPRGKQSFATWLRKSVGLSPAEIGILREAAGPALPHDPTALARLVKSVALEVHQFAGLDRAISTAGGVALDALDADLMLKARPGLFIAGEMLDWEAPTGGYLLQACFATGRAAGEGVLHYLGRTS